MKGIKEEEVKGKSIYIFILSWLQYHQQNLNARIFQHLYIIRTTKERGIASRGKTIVFENNNNN